MNYIDFDAIIQKNTLLQYFSMEHNEYQGIEHWKQRYIMNRVYEDILIMKCKDCEYKYNIQNTAECGITNRLSI